MRFTVKVLFIITFFLILGISMGTIAFAAPKAELWPHWQANDPQSNISVDHSAWAQFLDKYLVVGKSGAVNRVRYAAVSSADKDNLAKYIDTLVAVPITKLNRAEQKAVWINLYNALTVHTILGHYPVKSIRDIRSGWFSGGPWDLKLIKVEGI
ncbi:MAG: DUF547 domain-containing protein, partial [Thermodesulfobacteriota bacterium]|nr:DUF547 domain-containing protein [Thermodesulfobacteriota bacterium]